MTLQDTSAREVSSETSDRIEHEGAAMPAKATEPSTWSQRLVARIKQGERFRACAYFLATIL